MNENFIQEIKILKSKLRQDSYINNIPFIQTACKITFHNRITILTGENGSGKSTLLEGIAASYGLNAEGGTRNFQPHSSNVSADLADALTIRRGIHRPQDEFFFRAESFFNIATQIDNYEQEQAGYLRYYGGKSLHNQSHGESFLALAQNRFSPDSLYILDEPESALSPQRQLTLLLIIHELAQQGTQFIIATHSPILVGMPGAEILALDDCGIKEISCEETECFQIMKMFVTQKEKLLSELLR